MGCNKNAAGSSLVLTSCSFSVNAKWSVCLSGGGDTDDLDMVGLTHGQHMLRVHSMSTS